MGSKKKAAEIRTRVCVILFSYQTLNEVFAVQILLVKNFCFDQNNLMDDNNKNLIEDEAL